MLKEIDLQISKLEYIKQNLNNTPIPLELEKELKENKYIKEITQEYFEEEVIDKINKQIELINELKKNQIKITKNQNEKYKSYINYLNKIKETINQIIKLLNKVKEQKSYIDLEIIKLLKIEDPETLKKVIEYNRNIKEQKSGKKEQEKKEQIKIEENKQPEKKEQEKPSIKKENKQPEKKEEIKIKEKNIEEKIHMFENINELNEYLNKTYNITIQTDKEIDELNETLEIIEKEPFKTDNNLIKKILEITPIWIIKMIKEILEETKIDFDIIKNHEYILEQDGENFLAFSNIIHNSSSTQERDLLLKKDKTRKINMLKNKLITELYKMQKTPLSALIKPLDIEKLDNLLEVGCDTKTMEERIMIQKNELDQLQYIIENIKQEDLYAMYIGGTILNIPATMPTDLETYKKNVFNELKKNSKSLGNIRLDKMISKNPILYEEEETNRKSKENYIDTYISMYGAKEMPLFQLNNPYFELLENKYFISKHLNKKFKINPQIYIIPLNNKKLNKMGAVMISRNKVTRLLSQHLLQEGEITKDDIKKCIFYNLIITDEILEDLDNTLTNEFEKIDNTNKIKKIKKSSQMKR